MISCQSGRAVLAVAVVLTTTACLSKFPLDDTPQHDIDPQLVGVWRCLPSNEDATEEAATLTVRRATQRTYAISFEAKGDDTERYDGYPSQVGNVTFVNVREVGAHPSAAPWDYARYSFLLPNVLQLRIVEDKILKDTPSSPAEFREALAHHLDDPALYADFSICVRAREDDKADSQ